jgi:3-phosphoshikimate 1-carboxyvinyltransferase
VIAPRNGVRVPKASYRSVVIPPEAHTAYQSTLDSMPDPLAIIPLGPSRPGEVFVKPPGSKSLTNRAVLLSALAIGESVLSGALLDADDAQVMLRAIQQLGARVEVSGDAVRIVGVGAPSEPTTWKRPPGNNPVTLNLNNAGTATRFLAAAAMLAPKDSGGIIIDGDVRMRERPIKELADALDALGVRVAFLRGNGCPPLYVEAGGPRQRRVRFGRTASSQFISALMLVAPFLEDGLTIELTEPPTSEPYVEMTRRVLAEFGVSTRRQESGPGVIEVPAAVIRGRSVRVEPDASGATYFAAAAALTPGLRVVIEGLPRDSLQGDARFFDVLIAAGCAESSASGTLGPPRLRAMDVDLADMPDTAMTAAVVACFADAGADGRPATSILRGLRTLRVKETDRLAALKRELEKLGVTIEIRAERHRGGPDEALLITPPVGGTSRASDRVEFDTYHDHRMAMSLALIGLRRPGVFIRDPGCVRKTYPNYWRDFAKLYG